MIKEVIKKYGLWWLPLQLTVMAIALVYLIVTHFSRPESVFYRLKPLGIFHPLGSPNDGGRYEFNGTFFTINNGTRLLLDETLIRFDTQSEGIYWYLQNQDTLDKLGIEFAKYEGRAQKGMHVIAALSLNIDVD